jgi:hypothetical protein
MSVVKYICEFFFGNFWHFAGLVVLVGLLIPRITIERHKEEKGDKE